ncbi:MAG: hypothetical protein LBD58_06545, partial [Treponema sp.]|nr:hypothetical protein [Treponema sp.]
MANDKESSIHDNQNGAGSASELDEYGVWVKSDPAETSASEKEDIDFSILNDESSPNFEIGEIEEISADGLDLPVEEDIDDFEKEFIPENLENGAEDLDAMSFDSMFDPGVDDIEELQVEDILKADPDFLTEENQKISEVPTIDALSFGGDAEEAAEPASGQSAIDEAASSENAFERGVSGGETAQTDVGGENAAISEEVLAQAEDIAERGITELFLEDLLDDSPFEDDEIPDEDDEAFAPETEESAAQPLENSPALETVEAESKPVEGEEASSAEGEAFVEAEAVPVEREGAVEEAFAPETEESAAQPLENSPAPETVEAESKPVEGEEASAEGEAFVEAEAVPAEREGAADEAFAPEIEESAAQPLENSPAPETVEAEASNASAPAVDTPVEVKPEKPTAQPVTQTNLSTELLLRIAEELSSIRQELSTLKQDFLAIRAHEPAVYAPKPVEENPPKAEKEDATPQSAQGGFFDDSDDEKIALTGNELDNVLISADFIEEAGEDLLEDTLEAVGIEPAPETSEEISFEIEKVLLDPSTDTEELRRLREEGVELITPAPEDSSYLEADPAAEHELEAEDIDLSDVIIDEPDLSGQLQENPLQEPV